MFSALRIRMLELILPSSKRNHKRFRSRSRSRSRLQTPLNRVQDGRISKPITPRDVSASVKAVMDSTTVSSPRVSRPNNSQSNPTSMGGASDDSSMSDTSDIISMSGDPHHAVVNGNQSDFITLADNGHKPPPETGSGSNRNRDSAPGTNSPEKAYPSPPNTNTPNRIRSSKQWKKKKISIKPKPPGHPDRDVIPEELSSPDSPTDSFKGNNKLPVLNKTEEAEHFLDLEVEGSSIRNSLALEYHPLWTAAEIDVFNKLNMRGFEPLLPRTWALDFPTVPSALFTDDTQEAFLNAIYGSDFRATRALSILLELGARVRDYISLNLPPEQLISRYIQQYIKWSHRDGHLVTKNPIPILVVVTGRDDETVEAVVDRASREIYDLGKRYRRNWLLPKPPKFPKPKKDQAADCADNTADNDEKGLDGDEEPDEFDPPLPTVYGLVIAYTTVSLITYDSDQPEREMKALALFDFMLDDQDVWNAFAIAIVVVWARNYLVGLGWDDVPQIERSDPDF
ncbi:hypothetical protein MMC26_002675 [Xylographa opegraphella]|nr:hypothetical protein [Xylographa opegraphella]